MQVKIIELPQVDGDLYRFEDLPSLIAEALHPEHRYPDDYILRCAIWRDDGGGGAYFRCSPPEDKLCTEIGDAARWTIEPIELTDEERKHPDRSKWVNWRLDEQRRPADEQRLWPDGSLLIDSEWTQYQTLRAVSLAAEYDWYCKHLREAADRHPSDSARLCILDSLGNEMDYRPGRSIDRGLIHIDELNRWGATQRPPRSFAIKPAETAAPDFNNVRSYVMFERLRPSSDQFRGGRISEVDLLTLSEAAVMATRHAEREITVSDILRAAGRGEILLRAIVHQRARVVMANGGIGVNAGHPTDENTIPKGSIPTLPLVACSQLANVGRATWRTFDEVRAGKDGEQWRSVKYQLEPREADFETLPEDCRVTGYDVHALADAFAEKEPEQHSGIDEAPEITVENQPLDMLATRQQLVDSFGRFVGMDVSWFERLNDIPALRDARKIVGRPGRAGHRSEPMFCPFEVMVYLTKKGRKVQAPLSQDKGWELLEKHFPKVYAAKHIGDPRGH